MILGKSEIEKLLPHREPMLLVDEMMVLDVESRTVCRHKTRKGNSEDFSFALVIESFCQAGGLQYLLAITPESRAGKIMILSSVEGVTFHSGVKVGETLTHTTIIERAFADAAIIKGTVHVGERLVANIEKAVIALRVSTSMPVQKPRLHEVELRKPS
jgi:3-hydroxyacyl-[acyl-carrier-protein] dehydratase